MLITITGTGFTPNSELEIYKLPDKIKVMNRGVSKDGKTLFANIDVTPQTPIGVYQVQVNNLDDPSVPGPNFTVSAPTLTVENICFFGNNYQGFWLKYTLPVFSQSKDSIQLIQIVFSTNVDCDSVSTPNNEGDKPKDSTLVLLKSSNLTPAIKYKGDLVPIDWTCSGSVIEFGPLNDLPFPVGIFRLRLSSGDNGIKSQSGGVLDGNGDGKAGDHFIFDFAITE